MSVFSPKVLTESINAIEPAVPSIVLQKAFIVKDKQYSDILEIETTDGTKKLAPLVSDVEGGKIIEGTSKKVDTIEAPRFRPKVHIPAKKLLLDQGAAVHISAEERKKRQKTVVANEQLNMKNSTTRTREFMCCQLISTGAVVIESESAKINIDYGIPAEQKITLTGSDIFSDPTADIMGFFRKGRKLAAKCGEKNIVAFADPLTVENILKNDGVKKALDTKNVQAGKLTYDEAEYVATLAGVELYEVDEQYEDKDGNEINMFPDNTLVFVAPKAVKEAFGLILDKKNDGKPAEYFSKSVDVEDPSGEDLIAETRPCPMIRKRKGIIIYTTN